MSKIHEHHKPTGGAKQEEALEHWLALMEVDILCLQETKLNKDKIKELTVPLGFRSSNYDVFFCYPSADPSTKGRQKDGGLNGVATFAKKGLTLRANSTTLDDGVDLDQEGRCIMTDHGKFVIFNVYVPNGQGGTRMPRKRAFLSALERAMNRQREAGKQVILCGDLNIHYRPQDCFKYWRRIDVSTMCFNRNQYESTFEGFGKQHVGALVGSALKKGLTQEKLNAFLDYIASEWKQIENSLRNTLNITSTRGAPNEKNIVEVTIQLKAQHPTTKKAVVLMTKKPKFNESQVSTDAGLESGKADTVARMKWSFQVKGRYVNDQGEFISEEEHNMALNPDQVLLVKKSGCLDIEDLRKVLNALSTTYFEPTSAKVLPNKPADFKVAQYDQRMESYWDAIADCYGDAAASPCDINWLRKLLTTSSKSSTPTMVDPYVETRPYGVDRFTIWSQYTNERYRNEGTRIDFTLCDTALWKQYGKVGGELDGYHHPLAENPVVGKDQSKGGLRCCHKFWHVPTCAYGW